MKQKVSKVTDLTFTLSSPNKALVTAAGEVPTLGWTNPELGNDRVGDGILHADFLAEAPTGGPATTISPISVPRSFPLGAQAQDVTVHSETSRHGNDAF